MQRPSGHRTGPALLDLRAATPADEPFLRSLYADAHGAHLDRSPLDGDARRALLDMQFEAQNRSHAAAHPDARSDIVLVGGAPAGRLCVDRSGPETWLIDIALLSEYRARGVGGRLLTALIDETRERGGGVRLQVERHNPARRLYERLGFRVITDGDVYLVMGYEPRPTRDDQPNTAS